MNQTNKHTYLNKRSWNIFYTFTFVINGNRILFGFIKIIIWFGLSIVTNK